MVHVTAYCCVLTNMLIVLQVVSVCNDKSWSASWWQHCCQCVFVKCDLPNSAVMTACMVWYNIKLQDGSQNSPQSYIMEILWWDQGKSERSSVVASNSHAPSVVHTRNTLIFESAIQKLIVNNVREYLNIIPVVQS